MPEDEKFRLNRLTNSPMARKSRAVIVEEWDEEAQEFRRQIRFTRKKFDDAAKQLFLNEYLKWGRMGDSAAAAGVTPRVVRTEMERDEEFAEAVMLAEENYRNKLIAHHQNLVFNGQTKETFDRNGNLVSREQVYPVRLIELELKKHDHGYREKQEVAVNHSGGVLVAPAETKTIDDWESRFSRARDVTSDDEEDDR